MQNHGPDFEIIIFIYSLYLEQTSSTETVGAVAIEAAGSLRSPCSRAFLASLRYASAATESAVSALLRDENRPKKRTNIPHTRSKAPSLTVQNPGPAQTDSRIVLESCSMILLIYAHPDPRSFTAALAEEFQQALRQQDVEVASVNLYGDGSRGVFPAIMDAEELRRGTSLEPAVQKQMRLVEEAEGYAVVHPDWWGAPPAVLKGWIDRVLRPETAYEIPEGFGDRSAQGLLAGRRAFVAVSGDGDGPGPLKEFWEQRVWSFCGAEARLEYFPNLRDTARLEREHFAKQTARRAAIWLADKSNV